MKKEENIEDSVMLYVFFFVTITFVAISGWQTYIGYKDLLKGGALPFAIAIGLLLLFLNLALRIKIVKGQSYLAVFSILLVVVLFSFMGNFNAIYHEYAGNDVREKSAVNARITFNSNLEKAKKALSSNKQYKEYLKFMERLSALKKNIHRQITDPVNRGYGIEARAHVEEAERLLGEKLTKRGSPKGRDKSVIWWGKFADAIIEDLESIEEKYVKRKFGQWTILQDIDRLQLSATDKNSLSDLRQNSEEIQDKVELLLSQNLDFKDIDEVEGKTNKISNTFRTAFSKGNIGLETFLVALVSLLLDLFVPLVTLAFYRNETQELGIHGGRGYEYDGNMSHIKDMDL